MTDPADLAHEVLTRVAEFIKKLPADQLADLASGAARLEVIPKGGRAPARATSRAAAAAKPLPRPAQEIATTLDIGVRTVDGYRTEIMDKLGIRNVPGLVKYAIRCHLATIDE